ncbi:diphthine synthase, partial [Candidatus Woesearchaeota archaeon]|nr:diphthine synthase [Candidatus Woesearchaeota archaeon]
MVLNLIGIGINDKLDISLKGLNLIKNSDEVYIEYYTCLIHNSIEELEQLFNKKVNVLYRDDIENKIEDLILNKSKENNISLLVIGDPLSATTHCDLLMRAKELQIETKVVHNASVFTAISKTGLQLYKFGKVTSVPFEQENYKITTPIRIYNQNQSIDAHTLFLLDLDPQNNKFLTANQALNILKNSSNKLLDEEDLDFEINDDTNIIVCARLGADDEVIKFGKIKDLINFDF